MNTSAEFSISRPTGEDMVERVGVVFAKNENPKNRDHLAWQYLRSPAGPGYTSVSVSASGEDAAIYSVFKVRAKVDSVMVDACQSLDTLTDKNYRGRGLFARLAEDVYRRSDEDGVRITYGFPNSSSGPGFFNKLGWVQLDTPPFLFFINNLLFPLARAIKTRLFLRNYVFLFFVYAVRRLARDVSWRLEAKADFSAAYGDVWERFAAKVNTCIWRDAAYMRWRYMEKPGRNYQYLSLYEGEHQIGVLVYVVLEKHGGKVGYVMDVVYAPDRPRIGRFLLASAVLAMSRQDVDVILGWSTKSSVTRGVYASSLFLSMPRKIQPIKLFFGYRPGPGMQRMLSKGDFFVSYADSDTV